MFNHLTLLHGEKIMNFNLSDFTPIPKQHGRHSGEIEKGRIVATLRYTKSRPGFVTLYVGVEESSVNRELRYEPCVSPSYPNVILLKPCKTGCRFTNGSRTPQILRATYDRNENFFPGLIIQKLRESNNGKLIFRTQKQDDVYILFIDTQMTFF